MVKEIIYNDGIKNANDEDLILISDVDEIPNLSKIKFKKN